MTVSLAPALDPPMVSDRPPRPPPPWEKRPERLNGLAVLSFLLALAGGPLWFMIWMVPSLAGGLLALSGFAACALGAPITGFVAFKRMDRDNENTISSLFAAIGLMAGVVECILLIPTFMLGFAGM